MKRKSKEERKDRKTAEGQESALEELHAAMKELEKEKSELFEKLQRVSADYVNFQKRSARQTTDMIGYEKERIIKTLLPVMDNFDHVLTNAGSAEDVAVLVKGIEIIYDQMADILKSHGVEPIEALGGKFDPAVHQAMMRRSEPETEDNTVLEEFQKGYTLNGRAIRPSKVVVNVRPTEAEESGGEEAAEADENECGDVE